MKKSIVLLVSLFFIGIISLLIFNNVKNVDLLISNSNDDLKNTQVLITVNNYKNEIGNYLYKNKENIDSILDSEFFSNDIPLNINELNVSVNIKKYKDIQNINLLFEKDANKKAIIENFFLSNSVEFDSFNSFVFDYLVFLSNEEKSIKNKNQLNKLIDEYIKTVNNEDINNIRDRLGTIEITEDSNFVICNLDIRYDGKFINSNFIYDLNSFKDNRVEVKDFEYTFK